VGLYGVLPIVFGIRSRPVVGADQSASFFNIEALVELSHAARINHASHKSVQGPLYEIGSTYRALLQRQHGCWIESRMTNRRHSGRAGKGEIQNLS
jgi:hypothetical protein